jgi:hypothetical protein
MTCSNCADLCQNVSIRHPKELWHVIEVAKQNIADGTVLEFHDEHGSVIVPTPIGELSASRPTPDIIKADFRCVHCSETFHLFCETYHGSGGRWYFGAIANGS